MNWSVSIAMRSAETARSLGIAPLVTVALLLLGLAAAISARPEMATAAPVSGVVVEAKMTYHRDSAGQYRGVRMIIRRDGEELVDQRPGRLCRSCAPQPAGVEAGGNPVHVIQLDATPEPEVVFDLWAGGAHCCVYSYIYRYNPKSGLYVALRHNFHDFGYRFLPVRRGGPYDLLSADARFAYKFGCFGCSRFPPQVWAYREGRLFDATQGYPGFVRRDLRRERAIYRHRRGRGNVRPSLAALVADRCLLGDCARGLRLVRGALQRGYLGKQERYELGPTGKKFVRVLRRFLGRAGYFGG